MSDYIFPSDSDRAGNEALNDACTYIETLLEEKAQDRYKLLIEIAEDLEKAEEQYGVGFGAKKALATEASILRGRAVVCMRDKNQPNSDRFIVCPDCGVSEYQDYTVCPTCQGNGYVSPGVLSKAKEIKE